LLQLVSTIMLMTWCKRIISNITTGAKLSFSSKHSTKQPETNAAANWKQQWHPEKVIHPRTPWFSLPKAGQIDGGANGTLGGAKSRL